MALVKISVADVRVNRPLPYALYSDSGKLLLNEGQCIHSERQLERIFSAGAFRDDRAHEPAQGRASGGARLHEAPVAAAKAASTPPATAPRSGPFPKLPPAFEGFQLTPEGDEQTPFAVTFVGAVEDLGLLVTAPGYDALRPGVAVEGRLLFGRDICTFRTRISARSAHLPGIVILDYPEHVLRHPVRRHRRVRTTIAAQLHRNDSQNFTARVIDVSLEGVGLRLEHCCVEPGEHFRLALRLTVQDRTHALVLNCITRNVRAQRSGDFLIGAEIRAATVDTRALLKSFVFEAATGAAL